jgi:hypothetical protein
MPSVICGCAAYAGLGRWAEAQDRYQRALALDEKLGPPAMTGTALAGLGRCLVERGDSQNKEITSDEFRRFVAALGLDTAAREPTADSDRLP